MNKIRKILSVIPILSCICVLSLTTHAAENQNKNYLSDLRAYAGVESKENIIKELDELKAEVKELKQLLQNVTTVRPEVNEKVPQAEEKQIEI